MAPNSMLLTAEKKKKKTNIRLSSWFFWYMTSLNSRLNLGSRLKVQLFQPNPDS